MREPARRHFCNECWFISNVPKQRAGDSAESGGEAAHGHIRKAVGIKELSGCGDDIFAGQPHAGGVYRSIPLTIDGVLRSAHEDANLTASFEDSLKGSGSL